MEKKICTKCHKTLLMTEFYYHRKRKIYMSSCNKCNSRICNVYQRQSGYRNTEGYIFYQRAYEIKRRAQEKQLPVELDLNKYLAELWEKQKHLCYYTGKPMNFRGYHHGDPDSMTVDRVNPALGYSRGNIVLCRSIVNRVKQELSIDSLLKLMKEIQRHQRKDG